MAYDWSENFICDVTWTWFGAIGLLVSVLIGCLSVAFVWNRTKFKFKRKHHKKLIRKHGNQQSRDVAMKKTNQSQDCASIEGNSSREDVLRSQKQPESANKHVANVASVLVRRDLNIDQGILVVGDHGKVIVQKFQTPVETCNDVNENVENELWDKIRKQVKKHALQICNEEDLFHGKSIEFAELQISTDLPNVEQANLAGHGHLREDIIKHFNVEPDGNIEYTSLFKEVKNRAKEVLTRIRYSGNSETFLERHGNTVFVSGQPGIGKTKMTKHLVQEMWDSLSDPDSILFFVRFRDVNYERKSDFLQFFAPFISDISINERQNILRKITKNSHKVYLIMDGLDEAGIEPVTFCPPVSDIVKTSTTAESFIKNLLSGNILLQSKKLITSRPYQFVQLPKDMRPKILCTIQGLNHSAIAQICRNICNQNISVQNSILDHLEGHLDLKSYCHIPIICILVITQLKNTYEKNEGDKSICAQNSKVTLTSIFVSFIADWLSNKPRTIAEFPLRNISDFAFNEFLEGRFSFPVCEVEETGINIKQNSAFLNEIFNTDTRTVYFVHLMFQEFLSSVNLRLFADFKKWKSFISDLHIRKYEMVIRFMFGFCNDENLYKLLDKIEDEKRHKKQVRDGSKILLKKLTVLQLQKPHESTKSGSYFSAILPVLGWIFEMGDDDMTEQIPPGLTKEAADTLRDEILISRHDILPSDVASINHVLRARRKNLALKVSNVKFMGDCYPYFFKELRKTLNNNRNIQMKELVLKDIPVGEDLLHVVLDHCIDEAESFGFEKCVISSEAIQMISFRLKERKKQIKELVLEEFLINADLLHFILSEHCVYEVEMLNLVNCGVTNDMVEQLAQKIKKRNRKMEWLNLEQNAMIDDVGAEYLSGCLENIEGLLLDGTGISAEIMKKLKEEGEEVGCVI